MARGTERDTDTDTGAQAWADAAASAALPEHKAARHRSLLTPCPTAHLQIAQHRLLTRGPPLLTKIARLPVTAHTARPLGSRPAPTHDALTPAMARRACLPTRRACPPTRRACPTTRQACRQPAAPSLSADPPSPACPWPTRLTRRPPPPHPVHEQSTCPAWSFACCSTC